MDKRNSFFWFFLCRKYVRKIHEMFKIMNSLPRNNTVAGGEIQFSDEKFQQGRIQVFVENKTGGFSLSAAFDGFFYFFRQRCPDVVVQIKFCIFGYFETVRLKFIISEI